MEFQPCLLAATRSGTPRVFSFLIMFMKASLDSSILSLNKQKQLMKTEQKSRQVLIHYKVSQNNYFLLISKCAAHFLILIGLRIPKMYLSFFCYHQNEK